MKLFDSIPAQPPWSGKAKIAFVGEAPAEEEELEGLPLVGASGRTFAQILRTAGLAKSSEGSLPKSFYPELGKRGLRPMLWERSDFWVGNVFDTRLPDHLGKTNQLKPLCADAPERASWEGYEYERIEGAGFLRPEHLHHLQRLREEMERLRPTLIVPMGSTALWAFTGRSDISQCRGAIGRATRILPGCKILPTLHPAHVIQQWKMFNVVVADLIKAAREAEFPEVRMPKREVWLEPTLKDLQTFKTKFITGSKAPCAVDIETMGGSSGQITCIGFAPSPEKALVVPFVDYRKANRCYWPTLESEVRAWEFVRKLLADPKLKKVFQNGNYDVYWLMMRMGFEVNNYCDDTRLMHHALWQELPKSLGFMGSCYLNFPAWKLMRGNLKEKRDA